MFVDHPSYPRPGGIYADQYGVYGDNQVCLHQCSCSPAHIPSTNTCQLPPIVLMVFPYKNVQTCSGIKLLAVDQDSTLWSCACALMIRVDCSAAVPIHTALPGRLRSAPAAGGQWERTYGDDCVFIANDWHAAMVPVYLAAKYRPGGVYQDARAILAIHNLRHQVIL